MLPRGPRSKMPLIIGALAVVLVLVGVFYYLTKGAATPGPVVSDTPLTPVVNTQSPSRAPAPMAAAPAPRAPAPASALRAPAPRAPAPASALRAPAPMAPKDQPVTTMPVQAFAPASALRAPISAPVFAPAPKSPGPAPKSPGPAPKSPGPAPKSPGPAPKSPTPGVATTSYYEVEPY